MRTLALFASTQFHISFTDFLTVSKCHTIVYRITSSSSSEATVYRSSTTGKTIKQLAVKGCTLRDDFGHDYETIIFHIVDIIHICIPANFGRIIFQENRSDSSLLFLRPVV